MSSLWTPSGEHRVPRSAASRAATDAEHADRDQPGRGDGGQPDGDSGPDSSGQGAGAPDLGEPTSEEAAQLAELQREMVAAPAEAVVANHCYGLFELAALHLAQQPPQLTKARLAIDALSCLVEGLQGRLGPNEVSLRDGLAQIRMAFVRLQSSGRTGDGAQGQAG